MTTTARTQSLLRGLIGLAMFMLAVGRMYAQGVGDSSSATPARADSSPTQLVHCDGRTVTSIDVRPQPPYQRDLPGAVHEAARLASHFHAVTKPRVIRAFLALRVGDACTEVRREESERILRAQPFIADARVTAYDDGHGGVRLDVFTTDELSTIGGLGVHSSSPVIIFARAGDANIGGDAIRASAEWAEGFYYRDHYAAHVTDYEMLGHPWALDVFASRDQLGGGWSATMTHPFYSDLQRFAWIGTLGQVSEYERFLRPDSANALALNFSRYYGAIGGIVRIGAVGHDLVLGSTLSEDRSATGAAPAVVTDSGIQTIQDTSFNGLYPAHSSVRLNAIAGARDLRYLRVSGFDALIADQDLPIGVQGGALVGHSVSGLGSRDNDIFVAATFYGGWGTPTTFVGFQGYSQGRNDLSNGSRWDGLLTSARFAAYWKPNTLNTFVASTEFGLGLREQVPFELSLGDPDGGVRGFLESHAAGGERLVERLEDRLVLGKIRNIAAYGVAVFTDIGQTWAQGVPYGMNSPTSVGAGISLLAAIPPRSKRVWRVDFAVPVTHDPYARFEVRISNTDNTRSFYTEPRDVARAREITVPTSIFSYPSLQ